MSYVPCAQRTRDVEAHKEAQRWLPKFAAGAACGQILSERVCLVCPIARSGYVSTLGAKVGVDLDP